MKIKLKRFKAIRTEFKNMRLLSLRETEISEAIASEYKAIYLFDYPNPKLFCKVENISKENR
jgi:hypothetical protein